MQLPLSKPQLLADGGEEAGASDSHGHNRLIFLMPQPGAALSESGILPVMDVMDVKQCFCAPFFRLFA